MKKSLKSPPPADQKKKSKFDLSPGQSKVWDAPLGKGLKTYIACAGEQGGKTSLGALWFKRLVKLDQKSNYIVGFPTYKIGEQATRPAFLERFRGLGEYNGKDDVYQLYKGGIIYFRSSKDVDSVVGITNCKGAWLDEAGKMPRQFYYNIESRCARCHGPILITTTPYGLGWLKRDLIDRAERGEPTICYARWSSIENPTYPKDEYERLKRILPASVFRRRIEGIHEKLEGLIHEGWDANNLCEPFKLPPGTKIVGGVDWGFDHPMAIVILAITPLAEVFIVSLFKKSGLSTTQQLDVLAAKKALFHVELYGCGHDRPDMIQELQTRGIASVKYFEYAPNFREVRAGDQKASELIKTKQLRMFNTVDQYEDWEDEINTYAWEEAPNDDDRGRERPTDTNNDLMSAFRYAVIIAGQSLTRKMEVPKMPMISQVTKDTFRLNSSKKKTHWSAY